MYLVPGRDEMSSVIGLDFSVGPIFFVCSRNFGGRHDFDPSRDNHYTNRGIPCGEHTFPAVGARSCACDGTCDVGCPVVTAHMICTAGAVKNPMYSTNTSLRKLD